MRTTYKPRQVFLTRLWAFLNYRTTTRLTWLEILAASFVGLLLAWTALNAWSGLAIAGPVAVYLLLLGFYREWYIPTGWVRGLYHRLFKPLDVKPQPNSKYYALGLVVAAAAAVVLLWQADLRLALLLLILELIVLVLFWAIDDRERSGGRFDLQTVSGRLPVQRILQDGQIVNRDGTLSKVAIITLGRTGYKPALKAADVAETLTKFLAYLAQHEEGGQPIKLFWLTDYHLGQLDLGDSRYAPAGYVEELQALAESGAQKARVIITGIVYPTPLEERIREWLGQLDFGLSPLGAFAAESLLRMLFLGQSFLGQIQEATLSDGDGLPARARRGFAPGHLRFGAQLQAEANLLSVLRVNTPFAEARDALMRALQAADGLLSVTLAPLPRDQSATEIRGRLLAARVPGLGRSKEVAYLRDTLHRLEDRRSLEYLFDTQTYLVTWGRDEREAELNQNTAASYLTALDLTPLHDRALEDSLAHWLPVLSVARPGDRFTRLLDGLTLPRRTPGQRLLTADVISTLAREEGSDIHLADAKGRILLGRSVTVGKEGLRYADFRADTGPVLFVSDQGGGKTSTMIVWFMLRLQLLNYKVVAINLKYSTRMQAAIDKIGGIVLNPEADQEHFEACVRSALFSDRAVLYQPVKGTRPFAIADDPCLRAFMKIFYEEWLPRRNTPAALVIDEIHRLMPKDHPLSDNAAATATYVAEAFRDWPERKLVIGAATHSLRDLLGSNLGVSLQKFRTAAYFQVGPEDREMLIEKGYEPALVELIIGARRRPRGYCVLVLPDGFYTTMKVLVTPEEKEIIQRLDVEETADATPQLAFQ